ncbi:MAG: PD-(D/E)XK nuclease family protein [Verrucomicrobiota bacterium]
MPRSVLIDWNQPLIPAVTKKLLDSIDSKILDLSATLLVAPTVQSGRRLLEALALAASSEGRGILPPRIITPDQLLGDTLKDKPVASEDQVLAAWITVLREIHLPYFSAVFPVEPADSSGWRLGMAQRFIELQSELGAEGLNMNAISERAEKNGMEVARWNQMAQLESLYSETLNVRGLIDPVQARKNAAKTYKAPSLIRRILLLATPDPQPLALEAIAHTEAQTDVEVWIYGEDTGHFDQWGRPVTEFWIQRSLDFENWNCRLRTVLDPRACASEVAQQASTAEPESVLIGLADKRLNLPVAKAMARRGIATYDPEGEPLSYGKIGRLAELLGQLSGSPEIAVVRSLLQHPDLFNWLKSEDSQETILRNLDRLYERHLAPDLGTLLHFSMRPSEPSALHEALIQIQKLASKLEDKGSYAGALAYILQEIYEAPDLISNEGKLPFKDQAAAIRKLLDQAYQSETDFPDLEKEVTQTSLQLRLKRTKVYPDRNQNAHDLLGWLELLWNDAPHLILAGLNEGIVPEAVVGDAFLPETLRERLGLRTNADRFARDAYLLEAVCRRRAKHGKIDLFIPQAEENTTPLKPSRLLFLGPHETLVPRTSQLFQTPARHNQTSLHHLPWKLSPPPGHELPHSLSVSALKSYLQCPFRFFLKHILKMQPLDVETRELTPAAFGNLFHDTIENLKGRRLSSETKAEELLEALERLVDQLIWKRYGKKISFALRLQREALLARVNAFVIHQIEDIEKFGSILISDTENDFEVDLEDFTIRGRIDRIDQRGGGIELIDYKTSDRPQTPAQAHLAVVAKKVPPSHLPAEAFFESEGKTYRWTDLQLPLYVMAKAEEYDERPSVAYFNLAKTLDKSGIERWETFSQSHLDSARACAAAVIAKIRSGVFWPPNLDIPSNYDDYAHLFPDGIEKSVLPEAFARYEFKK